MCAKVEVHDDGSRRMHHDYVLYVHPNHGCSALLRSLGLINNQQQIMQAMKNFRNKVLVLQRSIRNFLVNRRFRWMMLELQWVKFERRRNGALKREWKAAWNKMMVDISKVFKVPPSKLRGQTNSRSMRLLNHPSRLCLCATSGLHLPRILWGSEPQVTNLTYCCCEKFCKIFRLLIVARACCDACHVSWLCLCSSHSQRVMYCTGG
jgi:hypothetical protein